MKIEIKQFTELNTSNLYEILRLRSEVFVVEQDCVYQDVDGKDKNAIHVLGYDNQELVAYTRIFRPGDYFEHMSFGRVVVAKKFRHLGYGKEIIKATINTISKIKANSTIEISAQTYLKRFYEDFGFQKKGEEYLEDGIPHIRMLKD
ncbi:GNAT family N-acetyltransferase [Croceivirga thetidis]|uniref:GNAT family N-acetyltransferase n=1 Tax=Croceivirga thetidis TaxID=2721623 RepID=A0ABX1GNT9_9FLAO|nr:GNAT family N-acetyltransferase [Croceivirga thetidis]NKI31234.1 GNAT family N-acetyltransferase [Croceivirga thetidis]